jgi:LDH2 family malate/lactate/ureidoglycolate dehydrogenase
MASPADDNARRIPAAAVRGYMVDAFRACGLPDDDAATVAAAMLDADLSGSDAHGIFRLAARRHQGHRAQPRHRSGRR